MFQGLTVWKAQLICKYHLSECYPFLPCQYLAFTREVREERRNFSTDVVMSDYYIASSHLLHSIPPGSSVPSVLQLQRIKLAPMWKEHGRNSSLVTDLGNTCGAKRGLSVCHAVHQISHSISLFLPAHM